MLFSWWINTYPLETTVHRKLFAAAVAAAVLIAMAGSPSAQEKTAPVIEKHLEMAKSIAGYLK